MSYEFFWICYWALVFLSVIISVIAICKKYFVTGLISLLLSLGMPIFSFVFALSRGWISETEKIGELEYLWENLVSGSWEAYLIVLANIAIICLSIYHINKFFKKKK